MKNYNVKTSEHPKKKGDTVPKVAVPECVHCGGPLSMKYAEMGRICRNCQLEINEL